MRRFGIGFTPRTIAIGETMEYVKHAEAQGFESVWMAEHCYERDATQFLTGFALVTDMIKLATAIVNPYMRNPALLAMTMATVDELSKGRAILGIGTGVKKWNEQQGIEWRSPLKMMRQSIRIFRELMSGKTVTSREVFNFKDVRLSFKPLRGQIPVYLAAIGPKMLRLGGEIADGVLLTAGCSPEYVKYAVEQVEIGAGNAGRNLDDIDISCHIICSMSLEGGRPPMLKNKLSSYLGYVFPRKTSKLMLELSDFSTDNLESLREAAARGQIEKANSYLTEEMLQAYFVYGTPTECARRVGEYVKAGVNLPIIKQIGDVNLAIEKFGRSL